MILDRFRVNNVPVNLESKLSSVVLYEADSARMLSDKIGGGFPSSINLLTYEADIPAAESEIRFTSSLLHPNPHCSSSFRWEKRVGFILDGSTDQFLLYRF